MGRLGLAAMAIVATAVGEGRAAGDGATPSQVEAARRYRWQRRHDGYLPLAGRFPAPPGFRRVAAARGSYAHWLRHLPLLPAGTPVRSFRGELLLPASHRALAAVVDLDVGHRDRQQCADTVMRLRGEYLHAAGKPEQTRFLWAGGSRFGYDQWRRGVRPVRQGKSWRYRFERRARPTRGYRAFRRYLEYMFSWTGTIHQQGEPRVSPPSSIRAGDFLIQGGSPGHVVVVLDLARDARGRIKGLLGQGFMPAQDMHVLSPVGDGTGWFDLDPSRPIATPLWPKPFRWSELRRFKH